MERLTCRRSDDGFINANVLLRGKRFGPAFFPDKQDYQDYSDALERLAQYEDIGLAPDEIETQLSTYSAVLCDVTHNRMSKTNYTLDAILSVVQDATEEDCESCEYRQSIKQYEGSYESGLLARLPCKPGDMVWRICGQRGKKHVAQRRVESIEYTASGEIWIHSTACDVFGKTVFLTQKEAEAALKGENK